MSRRKKQPVKVAFRPKKVTIEMTSKHRHRILSMQKPIVKFIDLHENPDRILIGSMERGKIKVFSYHSNPDIAFMALNEEIMQLNEWTYANLVSLLTKCAWFCGFYGKRAKKWKIKFKNVGNRNLYSRDKHGSKRT